MITTVSSEKPSILIQLDTDAQPSVFDAVVAVDCGVDHLFRHGGITPEAVREIVHGALFTRGPADLKRTAIFVGGSDVAAASVILEAVKGTFFGPFRVSVMIDAKGSNTTAASAVVACLKALDSRVHDRKVVVLGAGPVGMRIARLLGRAGARVSMGTPSVDEVTTAAAAIGRDSMFEVIPFETGLEGPTTQALAGAAAIIAAGPAGVRVLPRSAFGSLPDLKVVIDLNAVPPGGIEGVEPTDQATDRQGVKCWGALGLGGSKMKTHKAAIRSLFEANDQVLDADKIMEIAWSLV